MCTTAPHVVDSTQDMAVAAVAAVVAVVVAVGMVDTAVDTAATVVATVVATAATVVSQRTAAGATETKINRVVGDSVPVFGILLYTKFANCSFWLS